MNSTVPGRRNGFSAPYTLPQIVAWLVLVVTILQFPFFVSPMLPLGASIPVTILFFVLISGIVYHGGLTQGIDPMDAHLRLHLRTARPDEEARLSRLFYRRFNPLPPSPLPEEPMKQCWLCEIQVAEPSLHCRYCGKCVKNFDHHCMWLNTCIGKENYDHFFRTMLYIFAMQVTHIAVQVGLLVDSYVGAGSTSARANSWFDASALGVIRGVWIFFIAFDVLSLFLLVQLIHFHLMLQRKNLTTYAYIVQEAAKRRERMRSEQELSAYRTGAILKANHEGRSVDSAKLHAGRVCRMAGCAACDPLEIPENMQKGPSADPELGGSFGNALSGSGSDPELGAPSPVAGSDSSSGPAVEESFVPDPGVTFVKVHQSSNSSEAPVTTPEGEDPADPSIPEQSASTTGVS